jgi:hypothetical protein
MSVSLGVDLQQKELRDRGLPWEGTQSNVWQMTTKSGGAPPAYVDSRVNPAITAMPPLPPPATRLSGFVSVTAL